MTDRTKALGALALFIALSFAGWWIVSAVFAQHADLIALILVIGIAPPSTLFALGYVLTRPWWSTRIGRAMLISTLGLALLVDIALLYNFLGDDYALRDAVRLTVYWVICVGAWYKFGALYLPQRFLPRRFRRGDRD